MARLVDLNRVRELVPLDRLLDALGRSVDWWPEGAGWRGTCPLHPARGDGKQSRSFSVDPTKHFWRCHSSCRAGGDLFALAARLGLGRTGDFVGLARAICSAVGEDVPYLEPRRSTQRREDLPDWV